MSFVDDAMQDAIESAWRDFDRYVNASAPAMQASALVSLMNSMHDLATWHRRWNSDVGDIEGES